jgi:hypothetical protein
MTNFKVFVEPFSIFTYVYAKFHDLIPLLGIILLVSVYKVNCYYRDVMKLLTIQW